MSTGTKISAMMAGSALVGTEKFEAFQVGAPDSVAITASMVQTFAQSGVLKASVNLSDLVSPATARTNLGLGSLATQSASAVAITGGAVNGTTIGATTPSSVAATTLTATTSTITGTAGGSTATFAVQAEAAVASTMSRYTTDATACNFGLRKARGTIAAPAIVATGDTMGILSYQGHSGAAFFNAALIACTLIDPSPSTSSMQARLTISVTGSGSTVPTEVLRLESGTGLSLFGANPVIDQNRLLNARSYPVAGLPPAGTAGRVAYCPNARVFASGTLQGPGAGTGSLVVDNGTAWQLPGTTQTAVA